MNRGQRPGHSGLEHDPPGREITQVESPVEDGDISDSEDEFFSPRKVSPLEGARFRCRVFVRVNSGLLLVAASQAFFSLMYSSVKVLNSIDPPVSAIQVCVCSLIMTRSLTRYLKLVGVRMVSLLLGKFAISYRGSSIIPVDHLCLLHAIHVSFRISSTNNRADVDGFVGSGPRCLIHGSDLRASVSYLPCAGQLGMYCTCIVLALMLYPRT